MSLNRSFPFARPACIAGVRTSRPNRKDECGRDVWKADSLSQGKFARPLGSGSHPGVRTNAPGRGECSTRLGLSNRLGLTDVSARPDLSNRRSRAWCVPARMCRGSESTARRGGALDHPSGTCAGWRRRARCRSRPFGPPPARTCRRRPPARRGSNPPVCRALRRRCPPGLLRRSAVDGPARPPSGSAPTGSARARTPGLVRPRRSRWAPDRPEILQRQSDTVSFSVSIRWTSLAAGSPGEVRHPGIIVTPPGRATGSGLPCFRSLRGGREGPAQGYR